MLFILEAKLYNLSTMLPSYKYIYLYKYALFVKKNSILFIKVYTIFLSIVVKMDPRPLPMFWPILNALTVGFGQIWTPHWQIPPP